MSRIDIKGLEKAIATMDNYTNFDWSSYSLSMAKETKKASITRMASVSGEMVRETVAEKVNRNSAKMVVNVPYAGYNNQGERADGTHVIANRTSPGEKYFVQKALKDLNFNNVVEIYNKDLIKGVAL